MLPTGEAYSQNQNQKQGQRPFLLQRQSQKLRCVVVQLFPIL
jgi:hypothetical protein